MSWKLLDSDGLTKTYSHVDEQGVHRIVEEQDDAPVMEHAANLRQLEVNPKSDMRPVATIPFTLAEQWVKEAGISPVAFWQWPTKEQRKFFAKKVMSSDFQNLSTAPKKQSRMWITEKAD